MKNNISIISLAAEKITYIFNKSDKFIKWGNDNIFPQRLIKWYDSVPEHSASINFIENLITKNGINSDIIDIWMLKKIVLDYILFGGFSMKINKLRNGTYTYEYVDMATIRLSVDKTMAGVVEVVNPNNLYDESEIIYGDCWNKSRLKISWYPLIDNVNNVKNESIFIFKNNKSRMTYPTPSYLSALNNIDTASAIADYHNSNARKGFTPSTIINFNNGNVDEDEKRNIEKSIYEKFCGPDANKFILSFQDSADNAVTISKLDNDALDQKFETLQKFVQNEIIIAHQITSSQLIGVKQENTGFSKQEYEESLEVFEDTVIKSFQNELEHSFTKLFGNEIKFIKDNNINNIVE